MGICWGISKQYSARIQGHTQRAPQTLWMHNFELVIRISTCFRAGQAQTSSGPAAYLFWISTCFRAGQPQIRGEPVACLSKTCTYFRAGKPCMRTTPRADYTRCQPPALQLCATLSSHSHQLCATLSSNSVLIILSTNHALSRSLPHSHHAPDHTHRMLQHLPGGSGWQGPCSSELLCVPHTSHCTLHIHAPLTLHTSHPALNCTQCTSHSTSMRPSHFTSSSKLHSVHFTLRVHAPLTLHTSHQALNCTQCTSHSTSMRPSHFTLHIQF
ncbi:hypothetical protein DUNSADRAFT_11438 [Dunaliella salina]|uniref:Encoded protein n=1 Tax=Dunaliella salina TaxID=3046 RepID=A0ABQ7GDE1_DUNSA|nr:hypothetical protein DUNSADRAFT_11438 [Dunaliella salina]|eukprot:KAF5832621.1 hypothetical protein DUNSADRAFT_11438 [Dunaliella salina]